MNKGWFAIILIACLFTLGCSRQEKIQPIEKICFEHSQKQQMFEAAQKTLYEVGFSIDKADKEMGIIRTEPLRGGQLFEFWRKDSIGTYNTMESNLHSLRRTAMLEMVQYDGQDCIKVMVVTEKLNLPEKKVTHSGDAYKMFTKSSKMLQEFEIEKQRSAEMQWLTLGRDTKLENWILEKIQLKTEWE